MHRSHRRHSPCSTRRRSCFDVSSGQRRASENHRDRDSPLVHDLEVFFHDQRRFHQQPAHADGVRPMFLGGMQHGLDRALDAEVDHPVPVVGEDDVDEVLADVMDVSLDRREDHRTLCTCSPPCP